MSMNLHADKLELWQTPTWVTHVCLYTENEKGEQVKDTWRSTRFRYAAWVKGSLNGVWNDPSDYERQSTLVKEHLSRLYAVGEIEFWEM